MINWVENGVAPSEVIGSGNTAAPAFIPGAATTLTRPLCPYPQTALYNGSGNINSAASWRPGEEHSRRYSAFGATGPAGGVLRCARQIQARGQRTARLSGQRRQSGNLPGRRTAPTLM